ncbi:hypothetical protein DFH08DRAFT_857743 [Mycena albidolilacea]|uniref:Uncharacterized protein n=1 Tax=Mycena albidolilacea TaxID=1033008 RepID=A0AAD7EUH0_9AGAR|nr:hypothetical protein DFH08DRAFT_857743 [Mycena albidolilacea]
MIGADGHVSLTHLVFLSPPWGTEAATVYGHLGLLSKHGAYGRLPSPSPSWLSPAVRRNPAFRLSSRLFSELGSKLVGSIST